MTKFVAQTATEVRQHMAELANSTYTPTSKEEILAMDYMDLKILMNLNLAFYNAAIALLEREITKLIDLIRSWDEELQKVQTLDDVLRGTQYFGNDYEDSRGEFVTVLLDYLWDL